MAWDDDVHNRPHQCWRHNVARHQTRSRTFRRLSCGHQGTWKGQYTTISMLVYICGYDFYSQVFFKFFSCLVKKWNGKLLKCFYNVFNLLQIASVILSKTMHCGYGLVVMQYENCKIAQSAVFPKLLVLVWVRWVHMYECKDRYVKNSRKTSVVRAWVEIIFHFILTATHKWVFSFRIRNSLDGTHYGFFLGSFKDFVLFIKDC